MYIKEIIINETRTKRQEFKQVIVRLMICSNLAKREHLIIKIAPTKEWQNEPETPQSLKHLEIFGNFNN